MQCKGFLIVINLLIFSSIQEDVQAQKNPPGIPRVNQYHITKPVGAIIRFPNAVIRPSWYTENLAGFCRPEWKLEKATGIPLRLRLGSLEYVNRLEGKR